MVLKFNGCLVQWVKPNIRSLPKLVSLIAIHILNHDQKIRGFPQSNELYEEAETIEVTNLVIYIVYICSLQNTV